MQLGSNVIIKTSLLFIHTNQIPQGGCSGGPPCIAVLLHSQLHLLQLLLLLLLQLVQAAGQMLVQGCLRKRLRDNRKKDK